MNLGLQIFGSVLAGAFLTILVVSLVAVIVYALDRAAFDKQLDEMKAKAVTVVNERERY